MNGRAVIAAEVTSWQEATYHELDGGRKLTRATVKQALSGDLEGEAVTEFLMCYRPDGTATYLGQQQVSGTIGGRSGGFVVHIQGTYDGTEARSTWTVVAGSGTEDLRGLRGEGTSVAPHGPNASLTFDYVFE
jgi:hypothetical protein